MKLLGQKKSISHSLLQVVREVEERTGRHVKFQALPSSTGALGSSKSDTVNKVELISIPLGLPPWIAEVIAAHALMHSLQRAEGFCIVETSSEGTLILPWLPLLGKSIQSMIQDCLADKWAIARGFDVKRVIEESDLPELLESYRSTKPIAQEHAEWQACNMDVKTLQWAFTYAGLRVRYSRLNLFNSELDELLQDIAPISRQLGLELVQVIEAIGCETIEQCEASMIAVVEHIRIDPQIIRIKQPLTDKIIWPTIQHQQTRREGDAPMSIQSLKDIENELVETRQYFYKTTEPIRPSLESAFGLLFEALGLVGRVAKDTDDEHFALEAIAIAFRRVTASLIMLESGLFDEAQMVLRNAMDFMLIAIDITYNPDSLREWKETSDDPEDGKSHAQWYFSKQLMVKRILKNEGNLYPEVERKAAELISSQWKIVSNMTLHAHSQAQVRRVVNSEGDLAFLQRKAAEGYEKNFIAYQGMIFNLVTLMIGIPRYERLIRETKGLSARASSFFQNYNKFLEMNSEKRVI